MKSHLLPGLFLGLVFCVNLKAEISIDGVLDEEEWQTAKKINKFYEVYPYSLREVEDIKTEVLIYEDKKGMYFGFRNYQPINTMRIKNHLRDEELSLIHI